MDPVAGRILVVDDDAGLLRLMRSYLSRLGYEVDACQGAEEAWSLVKAAPSAYAVALVDLNMPGTHGGELARRILRSSDSTRLVILSGYPFGLCEVGGLDSRRVSFLGKPFSPAELADTVRNGRPV